MAPQVQQKKAKALTDSSPTLDTHTIETIQNRLIGLKELLKNIIDEITLIQDWLRRKEG